jgi:trigger factor
MAVLVTAFTEDEVNRLVREFSERLQYQGLKLEDYLKYSNTSMDNFKSSLKDEANKRIGYRLVIDAVVAAEKIEISDEELQKGLEETSKQYNTTVDEFVKQIGSKELFKYDLLMRKAMEIVTK